MAEQQLACENLGYERGRGSVLEGVAFTADPGEIIVIQGKNGSGKSTLLKLLAGVLKPKTGRVTFGGKDIHTLPNYNSQLAYIGHALALKPQLTVQENLEFWARLYGRTELIGAAMRYFDLDRHHDMYCELLSEGWKQRVGLARLIVSPAALWLLDEPMTHMDHEGVALAESLIATRREQGGTIVMALHGTIKSEHVKIININ